MTVRLLVPYGKYPKNTLLTTGAAEEARLLRDGLADTNTGAGTAYVAPVATEISSPPSVETTGAAEVLKADGRAVLDLAATRALVSGAGNVLTTYIVGDSLAANGYITTSNNFFSLATEGAFNWANALLGGPFFVVGNTAVGGKTAQQTIDEQLPVLAALTTKPRYAFVSAGHNDLYSEAVSVQTAYSRLVTLLEGLRAMGITPIWSTVWARSYDAVITPRHMQLNDMLRRYAASSGTGLFYDGFEASNDPSSANNEGRLPLASYYYDGSIHPNNIGAMLIGKYMTSRLRGRVPTSAAGFVVGNEDQTISGAASNLLANPSMQGAGGTAGANVTGTVPTGWTVDWATRTGTGAAAAAVVNITDPDSGLVIAQGLQLTVSGAAAAGDVLRVTQATGINTALAGGNVVQAEGVLQLATPANVSNVAMRIQANTNESTWAGNASQAAGTLQAFGPAALRTREMTVLGSGAASQARYDVRCTFNGAGTGTVLTLWKPRVRKVS